MINTQNEVYNAFFFSLNKIILALFLVQILKYYIPCAKVESFLPHVKGINKVRSLIVNKEFLDKESWCAVSPIIKWKKGRISTLHLKTRGKGLHRTLESLSDIRSGLIYALKT